MKRNLISQMCCEWRGNLWLVIEFTVIAVVLWYALSYLLLFARVYHPSEGYDFNDVYVADLRSVSPESPEFTDYGDDEKAMERYIGDLELLLKQIGSNPYVVVVGRGNNCIPFNFSSVGRIVSRPDEKGDTLRYYSNRRMLDGNAVRALRMQGTDGATTEQIAQCIENGQPVISDYEAYYERSEELPDPAQFRNQICEIDGASYHIALTGVNYMRRVDYEPGSRGTLFMPLPLWNTSEVIIRIKPGTDRKFKESMAAGSMRAGNMYISNLRRVADIRENVQTSYVIDVLKLVSTATFMLLLVFLGLLGTYWFRIQERVPEIAIRKVAGATRGDIFRRLYSESYILTAISFAIAGLLITAIIKKNLLWEVMMVYFPEDVMYKGIPLTIVIFALTVLAGIYFPARKAMKTDPSTALKEQ